MIRVIYRLPWGYRLPILAPLSPLSSFWGGWEARSPPVGPQFTYCVQNCPSNRNSLFFFLWLRAKVIFTHREIFYNQPPEPPPCPPTSPLISTTKHSISTFRYNEMDFFSNGTFPCGVEVSTCNFVRHCLGFQFPCTETSHWTVSQSQVSKMRFKISNYI